MEQLKNATQVAQEESSKRLEVEQQLEELKARFAQLEHNQDRPSGVCFSSFSWYTVTCN